MMNGFWFCKEKRKPYTYMLGGEINQWVSIICKGQRKDSHPVKMDRIRRQMRQTDQSSIVDKRTGDHADISEAGRLALKEKMVQMEKWERTEEIKSTPSLNSGAYGIMQDFEEMVAAQEGTSKQILLMAM